MKWSPLGWPSIKISLVLFGTENQGHSEVPCLLSVEINWTRTKKQYLIANGIFDKENLRQFEDEQNI